MIEITAVIFLCNEHRKRISNEPVERLEKAGWGSGRWYCALGNCTESATCYVERKVPFPE